MQACHRDAVFVICCLLASIGYAKPAAELTHDDIELIDSMFVEYMGDRPGAAVMIAKEHDLLFCRSYGLANLAENRPVSAETQFRIGSVSKQFTAMAVLKLVEEEKLRLETSLTDLFPRFPDYGQRITIHHLLTHQSGLPDYTPLARKAGGAQLTDGDVLRFLTRTGGGKFEPGARFEYSNAAYAVLAEIVRESSGQSFSDFVRQYIFEPAGMTATQHYRPEAEMPNRALGYYVTQDGVRLHDQSSSSAIQGDGSIYTSLRDFFQWHLALNEAAIVSPRLHELAYQPQPGTNGRYGLGWFIEGEGSSRCVQHGGGTAGFATYVARIPKQHITLAIFTNRDPASPRSRDLAVRAAALLSLATDRTFPMPPADDLAEPDAGTIAGTPERTSLANVLFQSIVQDGIEAARERFRQLKDADDYYLDQREMNRVVYALFDAGNTDEALAVHELNKTTADSHLIPLATELLSVLSTNDVEAAAASINALQVNPAFSSNEDELNTVGYLFMNQGKVAEATAVFELAVEAYPGSWNAYDSLGEAQLADGDSLSALANYQRSLDLNPENRPAAAIVWRLKRALNHQETKTLARTSDSARREKAREPVPISIRENVSLDVAAMQASIDAAVTGCMEQEHLPGTAVVVVHKGRTIIKRGYGLAHVEENKPVDPDATVFRIGSISKSLTLLALTRLVDTDRLEMADNVSAHFSAIADPYDIREPITVYNLLTHTTGLDQIGVGRHIYAHERPTAERKSMRGSIAEFLAATNLRQVTPPGEHYRYDTYGSTLAGAVLESVTGLPYQEAMYQEMFKPLGMDSTAVEVSDELMPNLAIGYGWNGERYEAQPYEIYKTTPASSIDATAADMGRLLEALTSDGSNDHGRFLTAETRQAVVAPQYRPHPAFLGVTHGLHESADASGDFSRPVYSIDHGGSMQGYRALLTILPEYGLGVFLVTNRSEDVGGGRISLFGAVMGAIVDHLPNVPLREPYAVPPADRSLDLTAYEGTYCYGVFCHSCSPTEFAQGAWLPATPHMVRSVDGALVVNERQFLPRGDDVFVRSDGEQMIYFGRNGVGEITFFVYSTSPDAFERVDD